jgi:hypothetical protein
MANEADLAESINGLIFWQAAYPLVTIGWLHDKLWYRSKREDSIGLGAVATGVLPIGSTELAWHETVPAVIIN